jgi:hypothetical protein
MNRPLRRLITFSMSLVAAVMALNAGGSEPGEGQSGPFLAMEPAGTLVIQGDHLYQIDLDAAYMINSRWGRESVQRALKQAGDFLGRCDIGVSPVRLHEIRSTAEFDYVDSRNLARLAALFDDAGDRRVTVIFSAPSRQDVLGFSAWHGAAFSEAVVDRYGGADYMNNKLFIPDSSLGKAVAIPHELTHILCNHRSCGRRSEPGHAQCESEVHATDPASYMHRSGGRAAITPAECRALVRCGLDNGFFVQSDNSGKSLGTE